MEFKEVKFKNFLSFGNNWNTLMLNNNLTNLITGPNGAGKSSLNEVVFFGFTGKPYRKIKKNELINKKNKRDLVVELTISHNNSEYIIKRGLKPSIFEIYKDGVLVNEDSHIKDYQLQLENMLGIDSRTFKQTIMMSSRYYEPFLDLNPRQKREFIENIFSIKIFSDMTILLKRKTHSTKQLLKDTKKDVQHFTLNVELMQSFNEKEKQRIIESKEQIEISIQEIDTKINELLKHSENIQIQIKNKEQKVSELREKILNEDEVENQLSATKYKLKDKIKKIKFLKDNDVCDKCNQQIEEDFKNEQIETYSKESKSIKEKIEKFNKCVEAIYKIQNKITEELTKIQELQKESISNNSSISVLNSNITEKRKSMNNLTSQNVDISDLTKAEENLEKHKKQKVKLQMFLKYVGLTLELLSEKGIRKYIIDKYIPIFNTLLNQNLKKFEAPYSVMFNNEFEETILALGYEDFSYFSLSSGEKQRLDTALVFSFLELCKLKNSVDVNVIFFDEVLDQSFDQTGIEGILKIFNHLKKKGYTIFVVSHREGIIESFDKIYSVRKKQYSSIEILG